MNVMRNKNVFKSMAVMLSILGMMFLSPLEAKSCEMLWCGSTFICEEDPCIFNVGSQFAIITCGEEVTIVECNIDDD